MVYINIHGYRSGPQHLWHPELMSRIQKQGDTIVTPQLPGDKYPDSNEWIETMHSVITEYFDTDLTLIGHSLGTRAILLYLHKYPLKVSRIILIGPFDNSTDNALFREGAYANFFDYPVDIAKIRSQVDEVTVIGSQDDSRIPIVQAQTISRELQGDLYEIPDSDHFLAPAVIDDIWDIIQK